jgi:hypothetical protein
MIYWQVGNKKFTNKWSAALDAAHTKQEIRFDLYDESFDRVDWTKEPAESWDQLLDMRAQQIAAKNKPIVLNFSGGTDSYTIYQVFKRNNIHIDVLYLRRRKTDLDYTINQGVLDFLANDVEDKTTKILIREDSADVFEQAYTSSNWLFEHGASRFEFSFGFGGDAFGDAYLTKELGTDDFISVNGLDKPILRFDWHGVYSYQTDKNFIRLAGNKTAESFYITPELPELHVKQSYLILNYVRKLRPDATPRDLMNDPKNFNKMSEANHYNWQEYSILASGRFGDLSTNSEWQHHAWSTIRLQLNNKGLIDKNSHQGAGQNWFQSLAGTKTWNNYTQGILDIYSDPAGRILFPDPDNLYKLKCFNSKFYKLNFPINRNFS